MGYTATVKHLPVAALLVGLALAACRAVPSASPTAEGQARRVVLVSFDGLAATHHARLLAASGYREGYGLAAFADAGLVVDRAIPVNPTLTAPSHIAMAAGATPARTGIVANRFHLPGTPITETVSGFDHPIEAATLWEVARRHGRRVGVLAWPGCNGPDPRRRADFGLDYVQQPLVPAATVDLTRADFVTTVTSGGDAPPRRASLTVTAENPRVPFQWTLAVTALDSESDGTPAYDTLLVDDDADPANGVLAQARAGTWFAVRRAVPHPDGGTALVGSWWLVRRLAPDLSAVELYRGEFNVTEAYPPAFREALDATAGFWPGPPDSAALERGLAGEGGLPPDAYLAQVRRFSEFFTAAARLAMAEQEFSLLLAYQPIIDEVQHVATLVDLRQRRYSEGLAATLARLLDDTYRLADAATAELASALDFGEDALVVVSDHGIAPVFEAVHLNEALRRAGLADATAGRDRPTVAATSQVVAVGGGGCAHLYVNAMGREPTGVVPPEAVTNVVEAAARALARLEVDGQRVVEVMARRAELAPWGLDHPNSGDLVVFMKEGFTATSEIGGSLTTPLTTLTGAHGYRNTHASMAGVWLARGAGISPRHRREAPLTEVAGFVLRLLGLPPPGTAP